jgi:hypothetical protein
MTTRLIYIIFFLSSLSFNSFAQDKGKKPVETRAEKKARIVKEKADKKAKKEALKRETPEQRKARKKKEKEAKKLARIPENIETFPKNFLFRPRVQLPGMTFNVTSRQKTGENFNWKASIPYVLGGAIRIKSVYISAGFRLPPDQAQTKKYGDTKFKDIYVNIQGRIVAWTLFFRDYKGFFLKDYSKFYPEWNLDTAGYPRAPNLHVTEGGINIGFNFNKNFSLNAAFAQSERQKKGAGSFLLNVSERWQRIETDTNIVPASQAVNYPNLDRLVSGEFLTTIVSLGFGYQFVMGHFHFTPVVLAGSGVQFQSYLQGTQRKLWANVPTYGLAKAQIGYNGNFFFTNLAYRFEFNSIPIKESRIRLYSNSIEFGLGVRF